jgi:hypothetical protein
MVGGDGRRRSASVCQRAGTSDLDQRLGTTDPEGRGRRDLVDRGFFQFDSGYLQLEHFRQRETSNHEQKRAERQRDVGRGALELTFGRYPEGGVKGRSLEEEVQLRE